MYNWIIGKPPLREPWTSVTLQGINITIYQYGLQYYLGKIKAWVLNRCFKPFIVFGVVKENEMP